MIRIVLAALLSVAALTASPASAQAGPGAEIRVALGEMITLRQGKDGTWAVAARVPVSARKPMRFDKRYFGAWVEGEGLPAIPPRTAGDPPDVIPADPGTIRFTFAPSANRKTWVLLIENGSGRWLRYAARMERGDEMVRPFPVCTVGIERPAVELIPGNIPLVAINLSALTPIDTPADGRRACPE